MNKTVVFLLLALAAGFLFCGCAGVRAFHAGSSLTEDSFSPEMVFSPEDGEEADLPDDYEKLPGFKRTLVGNFADFGFGLVATPLYFVLGYPVICVSNDEDVGQAVVYPFGFVGAFAFAAPVVILKAVFYDAWFGLSWLLTSEKGKVDYYISNIKDISVSEYRHLVELTGHDLGNVARHKYWLYSWGIPESGAVKKWRSWWKENHTRDLDELRETGGSPGYRGASKSPEASKDNSEDDFNYDYE